MDLDSPRAIQVLTELNNGDWLLVWCEEYSTSHGGYIKREREYMDLPPKNM